ncbi:MAG: hypothetical protein Q8O53_02715 [Candidatus Moranbacteria bacterium]|nr:hypothetical protein [Candidatus Moranbacteria bacterium]
MHKKLLQRLSIGNIALLLIVLVAPLIFTNPAEAAGLQQVYVRLDRLAASTTTGGTVCAKSATASIETTVKVDFPTGFTVNATATNWTVTTTNLPSGATAWIGIGTASLVATQAVTFPSGDMVVGTLYCFNFSATSTLTNSTAGNDKTGVITTQLAGPTTIDSSGYALSIVSSGGDQIGVTATVPATFTFSLGASTAALGTLSTTTASATGVTANISTNAAAGWVAWVKSANAALNSASTGATIATAGTVNDAPSDLASLEGYVLDVDITTDNASGTGTITQAAGYGAEYAGANATSGGTLATTFQPIAASNGTTAGDVLTLIVRAKISAVQAAATDYTDTLTVVAAGRF